MEIIFAIIIAVIAFAVLRKVLSFIFTVACVGLLAAVAYFFLLPMLF